MPCFQTKATAWFRIPFPAPIKSRGYGLIDHNPIFYPVTSLPPKDFQPAEIYLNKLSEFMVAFLFYMKMWIGMVI
jgi:hypothetical protein